MHNNNNIKHYIKIFSYINKTLNKKIKPSFFIHKIKS